MKIRFNLILASSILALAGCSKQEQAQTESTIRKSAQTTVKAVEKGGKTVVKSLDKAVDLTGDAAITGAVKTRLLADKWLGATGIDVTTKNNVVTLTGKIANAKQKVRATKIARETANVNGVKNNLKIGK